MKFTIAFESLRNSCSKALRSPRCTSTMRRASGSSSFPSSTAYPSHLPTRWSGKGFGAGSPGARPGLVSGNHDVETDDQLEHGALGAEERAGREDVELSDSANVPPEAPRGYQVGLHAVEAAVVERRRRRAQRDDPSF